MSLPQVYITDFWTDPPTIESEALAGVARVEALAAHHERELLPRVETAAVLLVWHDIRLSAETIQRLRQCKAIVRIGVGFDNVDLESTRRMGIPVCNVPDYGVEEVADHAIALTLALARNLLALHEMVRRRPSRWDARACERTPRLRDKVFGVIGLGRIGGATALRAKALGFDVVAFDPYIPDGRAKMLGIRGADTLDELLTQSDVVSLHTPLTAETRGMIGARELSLCKRGVILINTARGPICDTAAVLEGLTSGHVGGAGLDVLPSEPPQESDPLLNAVRDPAHRAASRCILTPHSAFYSEEGMIEMRRKAALEARRAIVGERLRNRVDGTT